MINPLDALFLVTFLLNRTGFDVQHEHDFSEPALMTLCAYVDPKAKRADDLSEFLVEFSRKNFGIWLTVEHREWKGRTHGIMDDLLEIPLEAPCDGHMVYAHRGFLRGVFKVGATDLSTRTKSFCYVSGMRLNMFPSAKTCVAHEFMHRLGFDHAFTRKEGYARFNVMRSLVMRPQFDRDFFPTWSSTDKCWLRERPTWDDQGSWIKCSKI